MSTRSPLRGTGRLAAALLAVVLGTGALTACGSGEAAGGGTEAKAAGAGFPRTIGHAMGKTRIPSAPKRVVSSASRSWPKP